MEDLRGLVRIIGRQLALYPLDRALLIIRFKDELAAWGQPVPGSDSLVGVLASVLRFEGVSGLFRGAFYSITLRLAAQTIHFVPHLKRLVEVKEGDSRAVRVFKRTVGPAMLDMVPVMILSLVGPGLHWYRLDLLSAQKRSYDMEDLVLEPTGNAFTLVVRSWPVLLARTCLHRILATVLYDHGLSR